MYPEKTIINIIIPALNEEAAIGKVIADIPPKWVQEIIVIDNNSTDNTAAVAKTAGATVLLEKQQGYGKACLKGIAHIKQKPPSEQPTIIVFLDGDYSDYPDELPLLIDPIVNQNCDLVIGSRATGERQGGAMTIPQLFGNWLAANLIKWRYGVHFTDLGPFRAIKWKSLVALDMKDEDFGWTVEMQVKAARYQMRCTEIPVKYRQRVAGQSKVSGTVRGTFLAGHKILYTIFKYW